MTTITVETHIATSSNCSNNDAWILVTINYNHIEIAITVEKTKAYVDAIHNSDYTHYLKHFHELVMKIDPTLMNGRAIGDNIIPYVEKLTNVWNRYNALHTNFIDESNKLMDDTKW